MPNELAEVPLFGIYRFPRLSLCYKSSLKKGVTRWEVPGRLFLMISTGVGQWTDTVSEKLDLPDKVDEYLEAVLTYLSNTFDLGSLDAFFA